MTAGDVVGLLTVFTVAMFIDFSRNGRRGRE